MKDSTRQIKKTVRANTQPCDIHIPHSERDLQTHADHIRTQNKALYARVRIIYSLVKIVQYRVNQGFICPEMSRQEQRHLRGAVAYSRFFSSEKPEQRRTFSVRVHGNSNPTIPRLLLAPCMVPPKKNEHKNEEKKKGITLTNRQFSSLELNPFRTPVLLWGQTTQIPSGLSPIVLKTRLQP